MSNLNETSFKNGDINVFKMTNEQKACLVALYYARLHSDDEEYKGVTNKLSVIADKLGMSYNSLHNYQQQLDPFFENGMVMFPEYTKSIDEAVENADDENLKAALNNLSGIFIKLINAGNGYFEKRGAFKWNLI